MKGTQQGRIHKQLALQKAEQEGPKFVDQVTLNQEEFTLLESHYLEKLEGLVGAHEYLGKKIQNVQTKIAKLKLRMAAKGMKSLCLDGPEGE